MFSATQWCASLMPEDNTTSAHRSHAQRNQLEDSGKGHARPLLRRRIAEEPAVLFACGMATMGFHPVAPFTLPPQRALRLHRPRRRAAGFARDFLHGRSGLSPQDGPTHHGLFDIAYVRSVPNCIAMAPKDEDELVDMMFTATHERIRLSSAIRVVLPKAFPLKIQPRLLEIGKSRSASRIFQTTVGAKNRALFFGQT